MIPKARYALRMLLLPLGLEPEWAPPEAVVREGGLYYGPTPADFSSATVPLAISPEAANCFEKQLPVDPKSVTWLEGVDERVPVIFRSEDGQPDLVASTFFWLSGWQELTTRPRDTIGRFGYKHSLQAVTGTVTVPAVDYYREAIARMLAERGYTIRRRTWGGHSWALCPTHDVDYLKKWRPGMVYREVVHYALMNHRKVDVPARLRRLGQFVADWMHPGDVYRKALDRIQAEEEARGVGGTFFFKAGAHGPHDVAYRLDTTYVQSRFASLTKAGFEIGLHPSFHGHTHTGYLTEERDRLQKAVGQPIVSVRQHYLRYDPWITPILHEETGFSIDSTLGFAEHEGFRHGTCLPFRLYDTVDDRELSVWEMPLAIMESALFNRRGLDLEGSIDATQQILATCRRFGGVCVALWHNTLWDELDYPNWGAHFLHTLDSSLNDGALVTSLRDALKEWQ